MKGSKIADFGLRRCDGGTSVSAAIRAASGAPSVRVFRDAEDQISVAVLSSAQQTLGKCGANSQLLCGKVRNI